MKEVQIPIKVSRRGIKALVKMFYPTIEDSAMDKMKTSELYDMYIQSLKK
jgi:hypothetical protein